MQGEASELAHLRPIHMGTTMCIKCASNPVCRIHMNPLEIQCSSSPVHLKRWIGSGLKRFKQGYAYHEIFGSLVGLACDACYIVIFCSALTATLGKKEACFLMAEKSGTVR